MPASELTNLSDHDLLITLHEQVKGLRSDIQKLNEGTSNSISDHETRIRALEQKAFMWSGAAGIIAAGASLIISHFIK